MSDRDHLATLLTALDASPRALRREPLDARNKDRTEATDYAIFGTSGHVYADGDGFMLYVRTGDAHHDGSPRRWGFIKKRLAFCHLTQDGDDEGCLRLDRLPTPIEAERVREAIGIRKRRHLSPEALAAARLNLERSSAAIKGGFRPPGFV